jgi:hypothetical protein
VTPVLCQCGCGRPAPIAKQTRSAQGHVKDKPVRFIRGHHTRKHISYAVDPSTGCWIWDQDIHSRGYGCIGGHLAHRFVYEQIVGPIPAGRQLHHTCETRLCVNPRHLVPLTYHEHRAVHGFEGAN